MTVQFELHWNLAQELRFRVDVPGILERSREIRIGDHRVRRMDDHDLVAHLLLHHFTHYFDRRIKWAVDLRAIASLVPLGVEGAIVGTALYEGAFTLEEALAEVSAP